MDLRDATYQLPLTCFFGLVIDNGKQHSLTMNICKVEHPHTTSSHHLLKRINKKNGEAKKGTRPVCSVQAELIRCQVRG